MNRQLLFKQQVTLDGCNADEGLIFETGGHRHLSPTNNGNSVRYAHLLNYRLFCPRCNMLLLTPPLPPPTPSSWLWGGLPPRWRHTGFPGSIAPSPREDATGGGVQSGSGASSVGHLPSGQTDFSGFQVDTGHPTPPRPSHRLNAQPSRAAQEFT